MSVLSGQLLFLYGGVSNGHSLGSDVHVLNMVVLRNWYWTKIGTGGPSFARANGTLMYNNGVLIIYGGRGRHGASSNTLLCDLSFEGTPQMQEDRSWNLNEA